MTGFAVVSTTVDDAAKADEIARALVEAKLAAPEYRVEIVVVAARSR